jgi:hypothetical protein
MSEPLCAGLSAGIFARIVLRSQVHNCRKFVVLRVPYVNDYFTKGMDGRIDDPNSGWKGRALWTTYATRAMFHLETGKGTFPKVVRFQLRPDPLAD